MKKILKALLMFLFCITLHLNVSANLSVSDNATLNQGVRAINKDVTFNFINTNMGTVMFSNEAWWGIANHDKVSVEYKTCNPSNYTNAVILLELWIDEDNDGIYEIFDPTGGYRFYLNLGDTVNINLPYGKEAKDYLLCFFNQTSNIITAVINIDTN